MDKYVRYCPLCDKYYPQNQMLCAFCFRDVILSPKWNSMSQQKKINWKFEHLPQVDISTLSEDSLKKYKIKPTLSTPNIEQNWKKKSILNMFQNVLSVARQTYVRSVQPQRFWMLLSGDLPLASQRKHITATTVIMNFN